MKTSSGVSKKPSNVFEIKLTTLNVDRFRQCSSLPSVNDLYI